MAAGNRGSNSSATRCTPAAAITRSHAASAALTQRQPSARWREKSCLEISLEGCLPADALGEPAEQSSRRAGARREFVGRVQWPAPRAARRKGAPASWETQTHGMDQRAYRHQNPVPRGSFREEVTMRNAHAPG